jgi:1-acyl-sn-glycerol-3-phosphate acyltransferase
MGRICALADAASRWFRFRCQGLENLPPDRSALLVGYHGRPAYDMYMLLARIWRERRRAVWGITHRTPMRSRRLTRVGHAMNLYDGSDRATRALIERREHICVLPGGTRECFRSSRVLYRVEWGGRRGYLRFARRHGLPIVPVASSGVDEFYRIYGEGWENSQRLFGTDLLPLCLPIGRFGVPFPFGLPRRVQVTTLVGPLIDSGGPRDDDAEPEWLERMHTLTSSAVQRLLDRARRGQGPPGCWEEDA